MLLASLESPFVHIDHVDHYRQNVEKMLAAKKEGLAAPQKATKKTTAPQPDIMAALMASIEAKGGKVKVETFKKKKQLVTV
jgi:non-homologous end joining protein Ku